MTDTVHFALDLEPIEAVKVILAWYYSDDDNAQELVRGIKLTSRFMARQTSKFTEDDFFIFYDALGAYPERSEYLEELYQRASSGWSKKVKKG